MTSSHLSDHLNDSSQVHEHVQTQQSIEEDPNVSSHLPSTSTPHPSSTSVNNVHLHVHQGLSGTPSAFTPYTTNAIYS